VSDNQFTRNALGTRRFKYEEVDATIEVAHVDFAVRSEEFTGNDIA
jgi:hypothetical protein